MTGAVLSQICNERLDDVAAAKAERSYHEVAQAALATQPPPPFEAALRAVREENRLGLIAEIKRASPSKGLIRADFDVPALAQAYRKGGATCLSVLTEPRHFDGRDAYIGEAAASGLPVLRKDFTLDPYQVAEARLLGASCILIIMAAVSDGQAGELLDAASAMALDALVEVHDGQELDRALALPATMIGINNRNLKTLEVDLSTSEQLAAAVPPDRLLVGESGLSKPADLERLRQAGVSTYLIGESLMRAVDVAAATEQLLNGAMAPHRL